MEKYICYLSLGANLGDRLGTIRQAVEMRIIQKKFM